MSSIVTPAKWLIRDWLHNRTFAIWAAVMLTVLVRLGASFAFGTYQFDTARDHWAFGYEWGRIAKWLVLKGQFSQFGDAPVADTDPLYCFIIAPFFYVLGIYSTAAAIALILFQSLLCGLSAWAIFVLAENLYGPFEARLSALLFALYPASLFFAIGRVAPSSLAILLLCLVFLVVGRLGSSRGWADAVLAGLLIGLTVLTSSDNLSLLLIIPLWLFLTGAGQRGRMILKGSVVVATALLVLLPWALRNSAVSGEASITKSNLGYHLYVGNNPRATGSLFYEGRAPYWVDGRQPHKQSEYLAMAISWIAQHLAKFLMLTLKRIQYFWYVIGGKDHSQMELIGAWLWLTFVFVAGLGSLWPGQSSGGVGLLWLFIAIYPLVFYITHASFYRHRYHIEPFVLILASHGLHRVLAMLAFKRQRAGAREMIWRA